MSSVRRAFLFALTLALLLVIAGGYIAGAASRVPTHRYGAYALVGPRANYLALGDSLAFGFQPDLQFKRGYADDWAKQLRFEGGKTYTNYGCPGETLVTFLHGGCTLHFLVKNPYNGPQYLAALNFINQNKSSGGVSPVSLDIGANDALQYFNPTTCQVVTPTEGITATLAQFDITFTNTLAGLEGALADSSGAPTGDLVIMNYYDPFQNSCQGNPEILALLEEFNAHIAADAQSAALKWPVPVADVFTAFGGATTPNPNLCSYTWICSKFLTFLAIHPKSVGYTVIYKAFKATVGY